MAATAFTKTLRSIKNPFPNTARILSSLPRHHTTASAAAATTPEPEAESSTFTFDGSDDPQQRG
ncbi:unnamed protein product [Rhodiola kirilowii]